MWKLLRRQPLTRGPSAHSHGRLHTQVARCSTTRTRAKEQSGALVHLDFDQRRSAFHLRHTYLHRCVNGVWRICVPTLPEFLSHVVYRHHDHVIAGHRGQTTTFQALSRHFYWPGLRAYTTTYVDSCVQCRASKSLNQTSRGLLQPLLIPSTLWSHVSLDFITYLRSRLVATTLSWCWPTL